MNTRPLVTALAALLTVLLVVPSAFLLAPQRVLAQWTVTEIGPNLLTNIKTTVESTMSVIEETITAIAAPITAAATLAQQINAYVLQPLAFVLSGNLMKMLTSSVIAFVIGKANGTGAPQFAVDVMQSLQTASDSQALAYLNQFGRNSNSPFAYSIASSLRTNYLQKTTLAGFWAANMSTLARSSPNVNAFLAGNWSQGGVAAWFALTTQTQNNPYTLYQASQAQMSTLVGAGVGGVTGSRLAQLGWGQGFMSWCGVSDNAASGSTPKCPDGSNYVAADGRCEYGDRSTAVAVSASGSESINPGDACTDKTTGAPGTIKTPGSVIKATLDKVLGGQQDQIVRMGNVGPQINQILGNIATVMQTVQFASQILGGASLSGATGGLLGADSSSASNSRSALENFTPTQNSSGDFTSGYLGASNSSVYKDTAASAIVSTDPLGRITQYESAWNTIKVSADAASTSAVSLAGFCAAAANKAALAMTVNEFGTQITPQQDLSTIHSVFIDASREQSVAAQTAITASIAPVLAQAAAVTPMVTAARAMVAKVQCEANVPTGASVYCDPKNPSVVTDSTTNTYSTDVLTLQNMPPTARDIANALQDVQSFGGAVASPPGSLNVSGSSLVDQMNLISTNAATLKTTVCNPSSSLYVTEIISG